MNLKSTGAIFLLATLFLLLFTMSGSAVERPDFQIFRFMYNSTSGHFFVFIKNNNPSAHFEGIVSFGLWINGAYVTKKDKTLDFKSIDTNQILLFSTSDFINQVDMSGNVNIKVKVDYTNRHLETNEGNNYYNQTFQFNLSAGAVHDLSLLRITKAALDKVYFVVKNNAPRNPFSGTIKVGWAVDENQRAPLQFTLSNLHAGHVKSFNLPYSLHKGRNAIYVKVDPNNLIHETNETNNSKLVYMYPNIAESELMKHARLGWQGKFRTILQTTNPALITPDTIGPRTGAVNRGMQIEVKLKGLGSSPVPSYKITVYCYIPSGKLRTFMPRTYSGGPVDGNIKNHMITFWVPKSEAARNSKGTLLIVLKGTKSKMWTIPFQFQGF